MLPLEINGKLFKHGMFLEQKTYAKALKKP
jgi:hypothetical protein